MAVEAKQMTTSIGGSDALVTLRMVSCHAVYHRAWDCVDGSIQGWFPTLDTILHSMMVQYSFVDARRKGHFDVEARINKLTLIDDGVALLRSVKGDLKASLEAIIHNYSRLGFAVEMSKTILRGSVFIFLNQLYSGGGRRSPVLARSSRV